MAYDKKEPETNTATVSTDSRLAARRKLLKAAVVGGGAATAATNLPDRWGKPVVDSVTLPVHAQTTGNITTGNITGVFSAPTVVIRQRRQEREGVQYAMLNQLIDPANASHVVGKVCEIGDQVDDSTFTSSLVFRINENGTVDVAAVGIEFTDEVSDFACGAQTTIDFTTNKIANVSVQIDEDEYVDLIDMMASASGITGRLGASDLERGDSDNDFHGSCSGVESFTALPGGTFPATTSCAD